MASPTPYSVSYSFAGWQAVNPQEPLPSAELDTQFVALEASIGSLIGALADVRRDDGNLQNGVVTWDGFSDDVKNLILGQTQGVTPGGIDPAGYATQVEAEAGAANDRLMTPLRTAQAIAAQRTYATQAQAQAGADDSKVMTPLRTKEQLDALRGFATQIQAQAGADDSKVMTPLRTKEQLDALRKTSRKSQSLTWGAVPAAGSLEQTVAVTGAVVGERVVTGLPATGVDAGLIITAWVSSADNVKVRLTNITAAPITPYAGAATAFEISVLGF